MSIDTTFLPPSLPSISWIKNCHKISKVFYSFSQHEKYLSNGDLSTIVQTPSLTWIESRQVGQVGLQIFFLVASTILLGKNIILMLFKYVGKHCTSVIKMDI